MEKAQAGQFISRGLNDLTLEAPKQAETSLGVQYLTPKAFRALHTGTITVLGAIAFGSARPFMQSKDFPFAWVDMPLLDDNSILEVWTSDKPVAFERNNDVTISTDGSFLFGCMEIGEGGDLNAASHDAYCRIFDLIDDRGYGHLLRVWNYFPRINNESDDLERYQRFSVGRHDAFVAKDRCIEGQQVPAACALGTQGGPLVVYFIAAKAPGQPIENPRQISAYHYPIQYGPKSPIFSRAMATHAAETSALFISGTASIVGHTTLHIGNVVAQTRETIANIRAVIDQATSQGSHIPFNAANLILKVYVRHSEHMLVVRDEISRAFGPNAKVIYLQADICRADLLLEIEGVSLGHLEC